MHPEHQYLDLLRDCLENGVYREGRNGGTYGLFGRQFRFDLQHGFPLLTTKRVHWKSVLVELLCFLRGDTNIKFLHDHGVTIWDEWADENGELGPVYGKQWRHWETKKWTEERGETDFMGMDYVLRTPVVIDQIQKVIDGLKTDPNGRRSEEHTSELQSLMRISYAVFCLKKKTKHKHKIDHIKQYT